jgi:hypothetical protein
MDNAMKVRRKLLILCLPMFLLACEIFMPTSEVPGTSTAPVVDAPVSPEKGGEDWTSTSTSIATEFLLSLTPLPSPLTDPLYEAGDIILADDTYSEEASIVFDTQAGSPIAISAWMHGCNWMGIAGQIFNKDGIPVGNLIVEAGGYLEGHPILGLSLTGLVGSYGPGGFEIQLLDHLVESRGTIWVQIRDIAGNPLSPQIDLDTYEDCSQNLIVLNFVEVDKNPEVIYYYPIIFR